MSRWIAFLICAVLGLTMLLCGLLIPAHLRAVDSSILKQAGRNSPSLVDEGIKLTREKELGPAQILFQGAQSAELPDQKKLGQAVDDLAAQQPELQAWGSFEKGRMIFFFRSSAPAVQWSPGQPLLHAEPFIGFIIRPETRDKAIDLLAASSSPLVRELLHSRALTNTTIFPASRSASGQAFDAAISLCGLLAETGHLTTALSNSVLSLVVAANSGGNPQPLEYFLLDLTSLGQRFNWGQLTAFVENIKAPESLRLFADLARNNNGVPVFYSSVVLSKNGDDVATFLRKFGDAGLTDLRTALRYGAGGVSELTHRNVRYHQSSFRERLAGIPGLQQLSDSALDYTRREPSLALTIKWILILLSGLLLAAAVHYAKPPVTALERPLQVRGFHWAREVLFALGFLVVVMLLSEPFLSQDTPKMGFPLKLRLPMVGGTAPTAIANAPATTNMNSSILTMVLFFVLQALLYVASLVKLAEIRRQRVPARTKLKLLENEDHLFDAGLYLGFLGTIISLILVSLGVFKQPSLMAAYSSTSFGILFVVLFKVVHLRTARRYLLLESEAEPTRVATPTPTTLAAPL